MLLVALPMAVGGTILSSQLIELLAGPQFLPAAPVLSILIWAPAILFVYIPVNSLIISQLTKKAALITGVNVVVNVAGNLILMGYFGFGIKAAALMTVFSETLQCFFYFYFVRKNITSFSFFSILYRPAFAALVMGLVLWQIKNQPLLISLVSGALIYLLVLVVTGFLKKEDLVMAKGLLRN